MTMIGGLVKTCVPLSLYGCMKMEDAVADNLEQLWISYNMIEKLKGIAVLKKLKVGNNNVSVQSVIIHYNIVVLTYSSFQFHVSMLQKYRHSIKDKLLCINLEFRSIQCVLKDAQLR